MISDLVSMVDFDFTSCVIVISPVLLFARMIIYEALKENPEKIALIGIVLFFDNAKNLFQG